MKEMYFFKEKQPVQQLFSDAKRMILAHTAHLMICQLELKAGHMAPSHHHLHEQCSYVVSGRVEIILGDECQTLQTGDSVGIRSNIEHTYHAIEDTCVLEIFYPLREDILNITECENK